MYFYKVNLPEGLDYASALIAFVMEGLLFANHLHGRTHMDVMVINVDLCLNGCSVPFFFLF